MAPSSTSEQSSTGCATDPGAVIEQLYAPIAGELKRVKAEYRQHLTSDDPNVAHLMEAIEHYSGKMLRPALLLLSARACGQITEAHIRLAAVAEMIHTATLVHDDILDQAVVRRQHPSIYHLAGAEVSVLLGDHLFSHALELALELDTSIGAHRFSRAVSRTCLGEVTQVCNRGSFELDQDTYFKILQGKTAELYATCCELGAIYAGHNADSTAARAMYQYGMNLGVAFQIMDDVLDLRGEESIVGKTLGTDLANGKATLPVLHWLGSLTGDARSEALATLQACRSEADRCAIVARLDEAGSIDYAQARAQDFVDEARAGLAFLEESPMRTILERVADFVISRQL